jgi:hypothetical protein
MVASPLAIGRYALAWAVAVVLAVLLAHALLRDAPAASRMDTLTVAAKRGDCVLRTDAGGASARDLDVMQPPTFGPPGVPAAAGSYARAPRTAALVAALRHGTIVLQYRAGAPRRTVRALRRLRLLAPFSSIVTPDRTGMRYAVAATSWGRLLGCPHASPSALAALQAFALRYRGRGPDA